MRLLILCHLILFHLLPSARQLGPVLDLRQSEDNLLLLPLARRHLQSHPLQEVSVSRDLINLPELLLKPQLHLYPLQPLDPIRT